MTMSRRAVLLPFLLLAAAAAAQDPAVDALWPGAERDAAIPTPLGFLGHGLGDRHTLSADAHRYAEEIARLSPRVAYERYGRSQGGRPLARVVIAAPAVLEDLDAIVQANRALVDGGTPRPDLPVTVWFAMSIHGNEASGVEAGLALLYHLASDRRASTLDLLGKVVLHIDLDQNPDGHDRFVTGVRDRMSAAAATEPRAFDHAEGWPGGRTSHYFFDMNRDWVLQTQTESIQRARQILEVRPQALVDFHEMGAESTFYFSAPPGPPVNQWITEEVRRNWQVLGDGIASAFDGRKWPYWTGDRFPGDFPGYGGAWPCLLGAAGFTFEQASARAGSVKRKDGTVLTLREALERHAGAGFALLEAAARNREPILGNAAAHFRRVREEGAADELPVFLLTPRHDPDRLRLLRHVLDRNGIATRVLQREATIEARPAAGGAAESRTVAAGTVVVNLRQPARPLALALLDPAIRLPADLIRSEEERLAAGRGTELYDITAWNLPALFGVESLRTTALPPEAETGDAAPAPAAPAGDPAAAAAWVATGRRLETAALLSRLLRAGVRVGVAPFTFSMQDRTFERGALVVLADRNREDAQRQAILREAAAGDLLRPAASSRTPEGHDLGSARIVSVVRPRIALAAGPGTDSSSFGAVRWLFEQVAGVDHVPALLGEDLDRVLEESDVLVLPDGGGYAGKLAKEQLAGFLGRGGCVVALRGAVEFLASEPIALLPLKKNEKAAGVGPPNGPIVSATLDAEHWLTQGLTGPLHLQARNRWSWLPVDRKDASTAAAYAAREGLIFSGFLPAAQAELLADAPLIVEKVHGRGRVVAFVEDVAWRGTTPGAWKLLLNAALLGASQ